MSVLLTEENKNSTLIDSLESIKHFIETELRAKQAQIVRLQCSIDSLKKELEETKMQVESKDRQLLHTIQLNEGNKQLINKLIGNISKLQNDIDWYKRTYESRSLIGTLLEKVKRKFKGNK